MSRRYAALIVIVACITLSSGALSAPTDAPNGKITYYKHIAPILQENCESCHRASGDDFGGMVAPMSLTTYEEVRPWAKKIAQEVSRRSMPPWFATEHTRGQFVNERRLTDEQIATVLRWVRSGAARGRSEDAPEPRSWPDTDGWSIGKPDLIVNLAEPFWVSDDVRDLNISVKTEMITEQMLPEPRYIQAAEFRAGSGAVHHIIASRRAAEAEAPGSRGMIGGIAPGSEPFYLPEGVGRLLAAGTQIYLQMHYNKEPGPGTGVFDRSRIGFKFHPKSAKIERVAEWFAIGNRTFEIPPGHKKWKVGAARRFRNDTTIYSFLPHMHLRGRAARYIAYYPDGRQELLLDVPDYDWNWQTNYTYRVPKEIPAGTRIEVEMWFENTVERNKATDLEINPNRAVRFGGPTTDEMMLGWIDYSENISP